MYVITYCVGKTFFHAQDNVAILKSQAQPNSTYKSDQISTVFSIKPSPRKNYFVQFSSNIVMDVYYRKLTLIRLAANKKLNVLHTNR